MPRRKQLTALGSWGLISIFGWDECGASPSQQLGVRTRPGRRRFEGQGLGQVRTIVRAGSRLKLLSLKLLFSLSRGRAGPRTWTRAKLEGGSYMTPNKRRSIILESLRVLVSLGQVHFIPVVPA